MEKGEIMSELNTIYILSKGRPECKTAQYLTDIGYTGDWFIVCGDNDETVPEYIENWHEKVLVFNHAEYWKDIEMFDNFGTSKSSGAAPVRNAIRDISLKRGELRHWQLDDDLYGFKILHPFKQRFVKLEGEYLEKYLLSVSEFAHRAKIYMCGLNGAYSVTPEELFIIGTNPYQLYNIDTLNEEIKWRSRVCDDVIIKLDAYQNGAKCVKLNHILYSMIDSANMDGGNTDIQGELKALKFAQYMGVMCPLVKSKMTDKGLKIFNPLNKLTPQIISDKYRKQ